MAIVVTTTTERESEVSIVYQGDPCVSTHAGHVGWVQTKHASVQKGADVLVVRPLNIDERAACLGGTFATRCLNRARVGVVSVNGEKRRSRVNRWIDGLWSAEEGAGPAPAGPVAVMLLGVYIDALTECRDTNTAQSALIDVDDDDAGDADAEGD